MKINNLIVCISIFAVLIGTNSSQAKDDHVKAMWVWDFYTSASTDELRAELIQFSIDHQINLLFIGTRHTLSNYSWDYAQLIQRAHDHGIRVFALAGKSSWALEEHHQEVLDHMNKVLTFNSSYPSSPFDGIQLDIEPYTLPGFADHIDRVGTQFLKLLQDCAYLLTRDHDEFEFNVAIPFWYATSKPPIMVTYDGENKPLSHHILDIVDSVSIMAYRNSAQAQIQVSMADVEYAGSVGKKAFVGAETMAPDGNGIPGQITYHHRTAVYMNEQLDTIRQHYHTHPGYGGIAVHAYDSFKNMLHREQQLNKAVEEKFQILKAAGIMEGYEDGSIGFGKSTTRAEVAVIAARLGGYSEATLHKPQVASFRDVTAGTWYYGWIESAHRLGTMNGKGDRLFDPNSNITVEEVLIVLAKTIHLPIVESAFVQGASDWAHGWVQAMMNEGLMDKHYTYTNKITREQLVHLVYETYKLHL